LKDVVFYSVEEQDRKSSYFKLGYYEKDGDKSALYISNPFLILPKLTKTELEASIAEKGIGLVVGNDTIIAKQCLSE
ncbi:MAG TPA: hypothetical protein VJL37_08640, partial [Flavobacterium sp.]|nr:hypothetical protein [Flavobacterium sp.]